MYSGLVLKENFCWLEFL